MPLIGRKSEEEKAAAAAAKQAQKTEEAIERARQAFWASAPGQARVAYERGDEVFQCAFDVMAQQAVVVAMTGAHTTKTTNDPTEILNAVCCEGWELLTGSFVFVEQGSESRDKFLASGQNVAVKGATVGYYLFKRRPNRVEPPPEPWHNAAG
jgi:hypothetical protein